jgi:hypothetical protein
MLDDREVPEPIEDVNADGHGVRHASERHAVESGDVAREYKVLGASRNLDLVVRIGRTKPRMRRVWIVAPELLMIESLDLLTGLSNAALPALYDAFSPVRHR